MWRRQDDANDQRTEFKWNNMKVRFNAVNCYWNPYGGKDKTLSQQYIMTVHSPFILIYLKDVGRKTCLYLMSSHPAATNHLSFVWHLQFTWIFGNWRFPDVFAVVDATRRTTCDDNMMLFNLKEVIDFCCYYLAGWLVMNTGHQHRYRTFVSLIFFVVVAIFFFFFFFWFSS